MIHTSIFKRLSILLCAGLMAAVAAGCASTEPVEEQKQLRGEVFYLNHMALPADAQLTVSLNDVSLADAPAKVLDRQIISIAGKQVPIAFTLNYTPAAVKPNHTYAVSARIELDGTDEQPVRVRVNPATR